MTGDDDMGIIQHTPGRQPPLARHLHPDPGRWGRGPWVSTAWLSSFAQLIPMTRQLRVGSRVDAMDI